MLKINSYICVVLILVVFLSVPVAFAWRVESSFDGIEGHAVMYSNNITDAYAFSPPKSIRFFLEEGKEGTGIHTYSLPSDLYEGDELWIRIYLYAPQGFDWTCSPITKLLRVVAANADGSSLTYHSVLATKPNNYGCTSQSPNTYGFMVTGSEFNSSQNPPPICQNRNFDNGDAFLTPGEWHCIELYLRISATNGIIRAWHNGILKQEYNYPTITAGGYIPATRTNGWWQHHLLGWWNGGPTQDQYIYFDNMVYTNELPSNKDAEGNYMIGPENWKGAPTTPPPQPPNDFTSE